MDRRASWSNRSDREDKDTTVDIFDDNLMTAQRRLRRDLLDRSDAIGWRPARDLAAHLLLHLDAPDECWRIAADWLREAFDADRVDCGFCLLYTSPSPRDATLSRMPSSA